MADKYEKIKVRAKSGLLVTKFKDKRTGKIYNQRPIFDKTKKYQKGRAGLGIDKELIEIQNANRQSLSPYLGLRNTNIGIGSNLKQQISNIKTPTGLSNIPKEEGSNKRFNPQFRQVPPPPSLDQQLVPKANPQVKPQINVGSGESRTWRVDPAENAALQEAAAAKQNMNTTINTNRGQLKSDVFTLDKDGKPLGVMTRAQRRKWDAANQDLMRKRKNDLLIADRNYGSGGIGTGSG